jgi:hypothetical protein
LRNDQWTVLHVAVANAPQGFETVQADLQKIVWIVVCWCDHISQVVGRVRPLMQGNNNDKVACRVLFGLVGS